MPWEDSNVTEDLRVALTVEQCWHSVPGGTAVAALGMARALRDRDDVDVIGVAARHRSGPVAGYELPIPVRHLRLPRLALYESWHRLRRPRLESATGAVDVIHATTIAIPPKTCPLVVTIHDLAFLHDPEHFTRRGTRFFRKGLQLALADADVVMCPSEATARDCVAAGFGQNRVRVIPLGVDTTAVTDDQVRRTQIRHGLSRPFILWTGTVEPRKNLRGLLEAWAKVGHGYDLVLVGPTGWNEDLDALIRSSAQSDREVRVLGFVDRAELNALYAAAALFCWPSHREGFGFPVLEAMAQGTPVVTSRGTSTEELAGDAAVLVDPADPSSIADGMGRVLGDETLAQKLGAAGRDRAGLYTWDRTGDLLHAAYSELAGVAA